MSLKSTTILVAVSAISAQVGLPLLAQVSEIAKGLDVGNMTAVGILCWYAYHTTSKTIPSLISTYQDEQKAEREMFVGLINTERDHHAQQIDKLDKRLETVTRETNLLTSAVHALVRTAKGEQA